MSPVLVGFVNQTIGVKVSIFKKIIGRTNDFLTVVAGSKLGLVHVNEYPKCGGTWVSRLIRSYRDIPYTHSTSLIRPNSVILKHELYTPYFNKPIIIVRDPRDVWVSYFFYEVYNHKGTRREIALKGYDENLSDQENLTRYIEQKITHPERFSPGFSYIEFIASWLDKTNIHVVKYEDVHKDPEAVLRGILEFCGEKSISAEKLKTAIEDNSFKKITGRIEGDQDKKSHKRKGIVGDWRNYLNSESCDLVYETQQDLLLKLEYEKDDSWVKTSIM